MKLSLLKRALAASREGRAAALLTDLKTGRQSFFENGAAEGDVALDDALKDGVRRALGQDKSQTVAAGSGPVFIEVFNPRLRCILVGAVHIAQPLARMMALAGYMVTVVDPRTAFASDKRFPGIAISTDWPDEALESSSPTAAPRS